MIHRPKTALLGAMLLLPLLASCVIVTDPDWDEWEDGDRSSWRERQDDNRAYIAGLRIGTPVEHIRSDLGSPDYSEAYGAHDGREVLILRYRTHHRHSDGETSRDETTPLVFVDGSLAGWGENALPVAAVPSGG